MHLEIGLRPENIDRRQKIITDFQQIKNPHESLMRTFNEILMNIEKTYQLNLHGVKEYSGIDIIKKYKDSFLGFQIKSKNDNIKEDRIRSQTSKALEWNFAAFVLIYGRKRTKSVDTSIQSAFHYYKSLNAEKEIYCSVIPPELFAELIIIHDIDF